MSLSDAFRFDGKRVLVVGGATGMGAAAAELALDAGSNVSERGAVLELLRSGVQIPAGRILFEDPPHEARE